MQEKAFLVRLNAETQLRAINSLVLSSTKCIRTAKCAEEEI